MLNVGPLELVVVLLIALIVVGPNRLPELSRQIGRGLREFRKVQDEVKDMVKFDLNADPNKPASATPSSRPASPTAPGVHRTSRPAPTAAPGEGAANAEPPAGPDLTG
jgi:Tat protein translocase TatB subunit